MPLSKDEIDQLLKLIGRTLDREIDCDQCLEQVAEFAENELSGKSIPESLRAVEQHLSVCGECHEEYECLLRVLDQQGHRQERE